LYGSLITDLENIQNNIFHHEYMNFIYKFETKIERAILDFYITRQTPVISNTAL